MMAILIALFGPQQVGKSTAALSLVEHHGFERVTFATPVYRMLASLLGISEEDLRRTPKHIPLPALGGKTPRHALQTLGTEWGRDLISSDIWTEAAKRDILQHLNMGRHVVVDDLRFRNEYDMLAGLGSLFVRLHRHEGLPPQENASHASEVAWESFVSHVEVTNPPDGAEHWARKAGEAVLDALSIA